MESTSPLKVPTKLVNPCLSSVTHQDLHRELLFNQKMGKNILEKSELRKALDKRLEDQKRKELERAKLSRRSSFEKRLEERARKCEPKPDLLEPKNQRVDVPEFIKIRAKVFHNISSQ